MKVTKTKLGWGGGNGAQFAVWSTNCSHLKHLLRLNCHEDRRVRDVNTIRTSSSLLICHVRHIRRENYEFSSLVMHFFSNKKYNCICTNIYFPRIYSSYCFVYHVQIDRLESSRGAVNSKYFLHCSPKKVHWFCWTEEVRYLKCRLRELPSWSLFKWPAHFCKTNVV